MLHLSAMLTEGRDNFQKLIGSWLFAIVTWFQGKVTRVAVLQTSERPNTKKGLGGILLCHETTIDFIALSMQISTGP